MSHHNFPAVGYHRPCKPQPCRVCGFNLSLAGAAGRPWRMLDTAAGLVPVCDDGRHTDGEIRDAHLSVERPEVLADDIDPVAAQADADLLDRLIGGDFDDLLSRAGTTYDPCATADDMAGVLARVLVAWRRDVDAEPIPDLVDTDTANEAIRAAVEGQHQQVSAIFRGIVYAVLVSLPLWVIAAVLVIWLVTR